MDTINFNLQSLSRRSFLKLGGYTSLALALSACGSSPWAPSPDGGTYVPTRKTVPDPEDIFFTVETPVTGKIRLAGHYWYNCVTVAEGKRLPAVVELNPYRRRDGTMRGDSAWYPYFAYCGYLVFRVDLQGSGDSEGILTDEYTDEELACCIQVIEQIAAHPQCDGNVGMLGTSWSAINSLMVAAHDNCPSSLKGVLVIPRRLPCAEDGRLAARLPSAKDIISVNADDYLPMTTKREASENRYVMSFVTPSGRQGTEVNKIFDSGCYGYGGPLIDLWVDQVAEENFRIIDDEPLSQRAETSFKVLMERPSAGWRVRAETSATVWSEKTAEGGMSSSIPPPSRPSSEATIPRSNRRS